MRMICEADAADQTKSFTDSRSRSRCFGDWDDMFAPDEAFQNKDEWQRPLSS